MTTGTIKTQGTELYLVNPLGSDPELLKLDCPTGIQGIVGGAADQIEDTCLDNTTNKTYVRGLGNPGQATVDFNFIPRSQSHQAILTTLLEDGRVLKWINLNSESSTPPTLDSDGAIDAPEDRTSVQFDGYISDVALNESSNEIVRGTLTIQRSGTPTWIFYDPTLS